MSATAKPTNLLDGKKTSLSIQSELKQKIADENIQPCLATVLVGERKDSQTYVRMKRKLAKELGILSRDVNLPDDVDQESLLKTVDELNADKEVNGILVQLPLPKHINEELILQRINPLKDVDGFHDVNIGRLAMKGRKPQYVPCTPRGCLELLLRYGVEIEGKNAVIIGRSNIVGIPMSLLLLEQNATVTICHSRTKNLANVVRQADIVVAAIGRAEFVKGDWIKEGAVVVDVGINSVDDPTAKRGYRLVGDVEFKEAQKHASLITPVPGGVGPMTVCQLMCNTYEAYKAQNVDQSS
uniref:Methenyltetrahydrofolate cyclohydrolase n=1 Tax=Percolomonas cosmopolitus TaxID=63605 RepID=A0A7S1PJU7_9EUKA